LIGLLAGAIYQITFSAAQRNNIYGQQAGQTWQLQLDGTNIGTYAPPESAQSYVDYAATFTASASSSHTIAFVGTDSNGGDNTVFIDDVRLALSPSLVLPHLAYSGCWRTDSIALAARPRGLEIAGADQLAQLWAWHQLDNGARL